MNLNQLTILEAHQGLKKKKFSVRELVKDCWQQIKKREDQIHAFITVLEDESLEQAKKIDQQISREGVKNFLTGIPLGIKDNILMKNVRCTAGSKILENYQAPYDATVIKKLKEAGAVFLGKTNLDEFAMGSSTENSAFGPTRNPFDLERVPGGSSGGSAAAVAAQMCLAALGSDTGGSIRQPAAFCGLVGLKPTYGRVSRYGLVAMASSLDQIGPLTKTVDDATILLQAIEGQDPFDSTSFELKFSTEYPIRSNIQNLKIGFAPECFSLGLDEKYKEKIMAVIKSLEDRGVKIEEVSLSHLSDALAVYYILMPAEVSANLARYDGIKFGYSVKTRTNADRRQKSSLLDVYLESRTDGFGPEVKRRIILGTYVLSAGYIEAYYQKAQRIRILIKKDFSEVFQKVDCLIMPTTSGPAFKLREKRADPLNMYLSDVYTIPINLAGLPAISVPIGKIDNLPVGLQIIGNYFEEDKILRVAKVIEEML